MVHRSPRTSLCLLSCLIALAVQDLVAQSVAEPIVFRDEKVSIVADNIASGNVQIQVDLLTLDGWQEPVDAMLNFDEGVATFAPVGEGIHRLRFPESESEVRFLAMSAPVDFSDDFLRAQLPENGGKLLAGEPFTILALGDSVTKTGDYAKMLAKFLERATGNTRIQVEVRAYPGRSVDASVRNYSRDIAGIHPDLALIMYGLNDDAGMIPLAAYLEQQTWLVEHLQGDFSADICFLKPTPHIDISFPTSDGTDTADASIFRTIKFAAALEDLGADLKVPVVNTFDAIWGAGAKDLQTQAKALWPQFPLHYSKPFTSLTENGGKGDTIHPNALGHLEMARAVYDRLSSPEPKNPLEIFAHSEWRDGQIHSTVKLLNVSNRMQKGAMRIYPFTSEDRSEKYAYDLAPGASEILSYPWPRLDDPADSLRQPYSRALEEPGPYLQILNTTSTMSRVSAVRAPFQPVFRFPGKRYVATDREVMVDIQVGDQIETRTVSIPEGKAVGRIPLMEKQVGTDGREAYALAELVFTEFGTAVSGEREVDGGLDDWSGARWLPVGEPEQARWVAGPMDNRKAVSDCHLNWSFAAGKDGIYVAFRGTANTRKDSATLFLDSRPAEHLGTVGPYYWVDLKFGSEGTLELKLGESSPQSKGLRGAWTEADGMVRGEFFVPYVAMEAAAWPESGDLGISIVWRHVGDDSRSTFLMWSENGHPWNPRWYGVVRLNPNGPLPYRVRVK